MPIRPFAYTLALLLAATAAAQDLDAHYDRTIDAAYATIDGKDFCMDVFVPNGTPPADFLGASDLGKGLGIVDVVSGEWHANRGKLRDHEQARLFSIFTAHGYTVFAVRPGSRPEYDALEMVAHVSHAIEHIRANAKTWNIDPGRLGLTGASAGAHLAALTAVTRKEAEAVKAVGLFFPPTDFLAWEGKPVSAVSEILGDLLFKGGVAGKSDEEIRERAEAISPARQVTGKVAPFRIYHGDADPLVPLQQSKRLVAALKAQGNEAELIVKEGGGHPWITIPFEIMDLARWFDTVLPQEKPSAE